MILHQPRLEDLAVAAYEADTDQDRNDEPRRSGRWHRNETTTERNQP